jgi:hypothetical protein
MAGITLEDFRQSVADKEIVGRGELDITLRQLRRRCGGLTPEQDAQLRALSRPRLEALLRPRSTFKARTTSTLGWQWAEWVSGHSQSSLTAAGRFARVIPLTSEAGGASLEPGCSRFLGTQRGFGWRRSHPCQRLPAGSFRS